MADATIPDDLWATYSELFLNHGLELLKKEEVKATLKEQYKALVRTIFAEIGLYIYAVIACVFFIFVMLSVILLMLVLRIQPFRNIYLGGKSQTFTVVSPDE